MNRDTVRIAVALSTIMFGVSFAVQPVAAVHEIVNCSYSAELEPLLQLIHNFTELLFVAGAAGGVAALAYAGIVFTVGSEDSKRTAKNRVRRALVGIVILLSSPIVVAFLVSQLPVCSGGG